MVEPDRIRAVVVLELIRKEIVSIVNQKFEEHQLIRTIDVWPNDSLPQTEGTGKLKGAEIRDSLDGKCSPHFWNPDCRSRKYAATASTV